MQAPRQIIKRIMRERAYFMYRDFVAKLEVKVILAPEGASQGDITRVTKFAFMYLANATSAEARSSLDFWK